MSEPMDDDLDLNLFDNGTPVVLETEFGFMVGAFIAAVESGIAFKMTHRTVSAAMIIGPKGIESIMEELSSLTVEELKELARADGLPLSGRKDALVERLTASYVMSAEESTKDDTQIEELAVPVTTFIPWERIHLMQDGTDWSMDASVADFRDSIPDGVHSEED